MSEQKKRTLGAIFYNNFELLDMYGPLEMFGILPQIEIVTVAEQAGAIKSTQGPKTVADYSFADCPPLDLILLPGGIGTIPELSNKAMLTFLQERSQTAEVTMSVCSGSAILAKAGLLDSRLWSARATEEEEGTHAPRYPVVPQRMSVVGGMVGWGCFMQWKKHCANFGLGGGGACSGKLHLQFLPFW